MRNIFKKSLFIVLGCLIASAVSAETMYVVSGKCNVPLKAGMNSAKYQIFTWDGTTAAATTAISCDVTGTGGSYYNTTSLSVNDLKTLSNYSTGSSSNRTMQAIKLSGNTTMTISLGSKTMSKVIVVGRANSTDNLSITILGETVNTNNKNFFVVEKEQSFTSNISINNTTSKEYNFFIYLVEGTGGGGGGGDTPTDVPVTGVALNKNSTSIQVGATEQLTATVSPNNATNQAVSWESNATGIATVSSNGLVTAVAEGSATITVTTSDGGFTAQCTVTVTSGSSPTPTPTPPTPPTPPTTLTMHQPETYEAPTTAGGYNTPLVVAGGREYEVYYINRDGNSKLSVATSNTDKLGAITTPDGSNGCYATDGWFTLQSAGSGGDDSFAQKDEFGQSIRKVNMKEGNEILLHVKGFDQFSLVGKDNNNTGTKCLKVYINNVEQTMTYNKDNYTIRRFGLNGESLIRITALSTSNSTVVAFSLRVAQQPRTKYLDGNDSTQVVYQTQEPDPVYYYTKYSRIAGAQTQLEWVGAQATGITLLPGGKDALGDTLLLGGTAYCQCGTYSYNVVSYFNNVETNRVSGKLNVATYIRSTSRDTVFEAFTNEPMDEITYQYWAMSADSVHLVWKTSAPAGISGHGNQTGTKYIISGTPTVAGNYDFTVKMGGGNSINGRIVVKSVDTGTDPVLYLYKNSLAYENDGVYQYLTSTAGGSNNLIPRKASENGPRADYNKYKWVLISEDVDADNAEVLAIVRDNASKLPVLNMKGFTYAKGRLDWGEPNNGTIDSTTNNGCYIYVQQSTHPIFNGFTLNKYGALQVLNKLNKKGVMPININNCPGTLCLAAAYTRNIEDYDKDGELQTIIHEVQVGVNGKTKHYICFPLANTKNNLTDNGKRLLKNIVSYLKGTTHFTTLPELEMTSFKIADYTATIDQTKNLIELELTQEQFDEADSLRAVTPEIAVKDSTTHVLPGSDEVLDLRYSTFLPQTFVVTDYINRRAYAFSVKIKRTEGLEDIYEIGEWVNIFDIYGRKIATTNEDIYTMELPRGMYIIVTEKGQSIKLMK